MNKYDWGSTPTKKNVQETCIDCEVPFRERNQFTQIKLPNQWLQVCFELTIILLSFHFEADFRGSARVYFVMLAMQVQGSLELSRMCVWD
ncbi:hypothetical protein FGO68_gene10731 [Halteria grandinella]|uniref:Uncharacterized protein n=1 Tax=Halteria grandinella TaxID=5974 RepID=A0A8J8T9L3_HALGN|nr:hypothetical protein FGO68_gene10731 [Halteria grandinella]